MKYVLIQGKYGIYRCSFESYGYSWVLPVLKVERKFLGFKYWKQVHSPNIQAMRETWFFRQSREERVDFYDKAVHAYERWVSDWQTITPKEVQL